MSVENILRALPTSTYQRAEKGKLTRRDFRILDEIVDGCEDAQSLSVNFSLSFNRYLNDASDDCVVKGSIADHSAALEQITRMTDHVNGLLSSVYFCIRKNREVRRDRKLTP